MTTILPGDRISYILRNSDLSWLLPNVRQDFIIWNSLNDIQFYDKFIQTKPAGTPYTAEDFTPSHLALIALDQYPIIEHDSKNILDAMDNQVIQMAIRRANDQTMLNSDRASLEDAGLLALAMAYNQQVTASWSGLLGSIPHTINTTWLAAIACLYGFADHPARLLSSLVQPATSAERYKLAIHAVLSNPLSPAEQVAILTGLCYGPHGDLLPASDRTRLLSELYQQRPQAAVDFSNRWLDDHTVIPAPTYQKLRQIIDKLELHNEAQFNRDICKLAEDTSQLTGIIEAEHRLSQDLCAEFISAPISHASGNFPGEPGEDDLSVDINKAYQLYKFTSSPDTNGTIRSRMALSLYQHDLIDEAKELLAYQVDPLPEDMDILYALAKIAFRENDLQRAGLAAAKIMEKLTKAPATIALPVWGEGLCLMNLGSLLLDLGQPAKAVQVFELALQTCPNDVALLNKLAASYQSSPAPQQAAEAYHALVTLYPGNLDYRRCFAGTLEEVGDWETSMNERSIILKSSSHDNESASIEDVYAFAHCALEADHAEQAFEACCALLAKNPEDYQALIYTGKAQLSLGKVDKGIEVLVKATQVIPGRAEAWLALASAQKNIHPTQVVIETLKNASQSVPDCAQIFFALGDLYLRDNAPTLALPEYRRLKQPPTAEPLI